jgi:hypothetical protein
MDKTKFILPITILLGCIILGGFYYASETNKQQSIEKQQQIEHQAKTECFTKATKTKEQAMKADNTAVINGLQITRSDYDKIFNDEYNRCLMEIGYK